MLVCHNAVDNINYYITTQASGILWLVRRIFKIMLTKQYKLPVSFDLTFDSEEDR